jgi:hypothetical protein
MKMKRRTKPDENSKLLMSLWPAMSPSAIRSNVISMYRNMLRLASRLPSKAERIDTISKIKAEFRSNASETDSGRWEFVPWRASSHPLPPKLDQLPQMFLLPRSYRISSQFNSAMSSLGFLRMSTPRSRTSHTPTAAEVEAASSNSTTKSPSTAAGVFNRPHTNWHGSNLDPDSVSRHKAQLKRMRFRDNAHAKGVF